MADTTLIKVKSFILHDTLNIAAKNFKSNTPVEVGTDMQAMYDVDHKQLFIYFKGQLRIVDNISYWEPEDYTQFGFTHEKIKPMSLGNPGPTPQVPTGKIKAQVEVPHEKVQNPPTRRSVHP